MSVIREITRFLMTAVSIAIVIALAMAIRDGVESRGTSVDYFLGRAKMSFLLAVVGGVVAGLPALWLARRLGWQRSFLKMTVLGGAAGAIGAVLLANAVFGVFSISGFFIPHGYAVLGAIMGFIAAPIWVLLHSCDVRENSAG